MKSAGERGFYTIATHILTVTYNLVLILAVSIELSLNTEVSAYYFLDP